MQKLTKPQMEEKMRQFKTLCRQNGLKITPQRIAVYQELLESSEHPSADTVFRRVRAKHPNISLDTVNRTLLTLADMGVAFTLEGSGDAKRFDGNTSTHQHFRCVRCKQIIDFHYEPFDDLPCPPQLEEKFEVQRRTVYLEGLCDKCSSKVSSQQNSKSA